MKLQALNIKPSINLDYFPTGSAWLRLCATCIPSCHNPGMLLAQVVQAQQPGAPDANGGITIREADAAAGGASAADADVAPLDARTQADADYARQLQAKMDAAEARGGPRRARSCSD